MTLQQSPPRQTRLFAILAILVSATAVAQALLPDQARPLWELGLTPATCVCLATAAWLDVRARNAPHLKRWALTLAVLGSAFALGSAFVTFCARGACFAI
jgi:hypothetical protein